MRTKEPLTMLIVVFVLLALTGCRQDMHDQPKYIPLRASTFFADGRSARPLVSGTVARDGLHEDALLYTGKVDGADATVFPFAVFRIVVLMSPWAHVFFASSESDPTFSAAYALMPTDFVLTLTSCVKRSP